MSGFEVIGVILGVYPVLVNAYQAFTAAKSDKGVESLYRKLKTEQVIYNHFVYNLLRPNVSEPQLLRLQTTSDAQYLDCWRDADLEASLKERLGWQRAQHIISIVKDVGQLLQSMEKDLPGAGRQFVSSLMDPSYHILLLPH